MATKAKANRKPVHRRPPQEDRQLLERMHKSGAFWDPRFPGSHVIELADITKTKLDTIEVKDAVRAFQESDTSLDDFAREVHGRDAVPDGEVGPATRKLATIERCPVPDHAPPDGVDFSGYDPQEIQMLRSYQKRSTAAATGSGSWPASCDWSNGVHHVRVAVNHSTRPGHVSDDDWKEMWGACAAGYAEMGLRMTEVPWADKTDDSEINLWWRRLSGSTIGLAEFNNGTCTDNVFHNLDPGYSQSTHAKSVLMFHEFGHNMNLQHTRGGVMNPSIIPRLEVSWKGDPSERTMRRFFGGEQVDPPGPDPGEVDLEVIIALLTQLLEKIARRRR